MNTKISIITVMLLQWYFFMLTPQITIAATPVTSIPGFTIVKLWPLLPLLMVGVIFMLSRDSSEEQEP